jgi:phosphate transport system substrate-binding protein
MMTSRGLRGTIGLSFLWAILIATGCGGGGAGGAKGGGGPTPAIVIDGSSTVYRISKAAQDAFKQIEPNTVVVLDFHGTGAGFSHYLEGEIDIVDASRPAKATEESKAKAQGIDWSRFLVGYDGITLVVNPKNDFVKSLTVEQLKKLWGPASAVRTWKDLDPTWPDREIIFYSPDHDSGTFEFFTEATVGEPKKQREDVQMSPDDNTLVRGITNDTDGLGYFGYAYYAANKDALRAVAIQNGPAAAPVLPSPATIIDKTYAPLSRPLYIYVKNSAARRPEVGRFLKFYLEKIDQFAVEGGYASVTAEDKAANQATLATLLPTTGGKAENNNAPSK